MKISEFLLKAKRRIWQKIVNKTRYKPSYQKIYKSYWHAMFFKSNKKEDKRLNYYSAVPNPGAGIGHQIANWIAGYWFAAQFDLAFAHIPFSTKKWDTFLGFGQDEMIVKDLIKKNRYKKVLLPLFDELKPNDILSVKKIIDSYKNKRVVFIAEQDQFYADQFGILKNLKLKFYQSEARKDDKLLYSIDNFNIAIHVRRGDIVPEPTGLIETLQMRWQNIVYFEKVLFDVVDNLKTNKPIAIYLFSQGDKREFKEFKKFKNLTFCLDMNAQDSFLHMVFADLLITSKSSFSYKPALLNNGIKVCPNNFWHGYPTTKDWILVDDNGVFDVDNIKNI